MNGNRCPECTSSFSRKDAMLRHRRNKHEDSMSTDTPIPFQTNNQVSGTMTFQHPFTMVISGPTGSGKTEWTRKLFLSSLIEPRPERIIWCFGQWQPLYDELQRRFPSIEFVHGIPDYISEPRYIDTTKKNLIVFDDLMTEAKCDQRIADLFTKGSHHRNLSVLYITQNLFPQGKACRDITLNTQYLVLFNNPIDRQQVATLAKRIYPTNSSTFMKKFEEATSQPYGYLVVDLKSCTPEQVRLRSNIFDRQIVNVVSDQSTLSGDEEDYIDDDDNEESDDRNTLVMRKRLIQKEGPPGKRFKEEQAILDVWNRRFKEPLRQSHSKVFEEKVNQYIDQGQSDLEAFHCAANDELPFLRKRLRDDYTQFLIDFHDLQEDPTQQQVLESAKTLRKQFGMNNEESIRQAIKLRKDLFIDVWPDHSIPETTLVDDVNSDED